MFDAPLPLAGEKLAPHQPEAQILCGAISGGCQLKEVQLINGGVALVDDEDYGLVSRFRWRRKAGGKGSKVEYASTFVSETRKNVGMHQLLLGIKPSMTIDHIDRDGLNNQRSNLRHATKAQQEYNKEKKAGTLHKYKGVSKYPHKTENAKSWQARARLNGKDYSLGYHRTEEEAARAYDAFMSKHCSEIIVLNFPPNT
jgi:hypothetical protein